MNAVLQFGAGYRTYIIAATLILVVIVEKGLGIDVPGVDVGPDWLTHHRRSGESPRGRTQIPEGGLRCQRPHARSGRCRSS